MNKEISPEIMQLAMDLIKKVSQDGAIPSETTSAAPAEPVGVKKKSRRGNGEGSIFEKYPGKWCAVATTGYNSSTGKPIRKTVYGNSRSEVRDKLLDIQIKTATNTYVEDTNLTLGTWMKEWLENYKKNAIKLTTWDAYWSLTSTHIIPGLGTLRLQDVTTGVLQRFYSEKKASGLSTRSIHFINYLIKSALNQAVAEHKLAHNPCNAVVLPKREVKKMKTLSREDVHHFLNVARKYRYFAAYYLDISTGMRRGEILGLEEKDLVLTGDSPRIIVRRQLVRTSEGLQFTSLKSENSQRTIPINKDVVEVLQKHLIMNKTDRLEVGESYQCNNLVFCTKNGTPIQPRSFTRDFQAVLKAAGLDRIRFHDLRHTFATMLLEAGVQLNTVQELLGHHSPTFTAEVYGHVTKKMKEHAVSVIGDLVSQGVK